MKRLQIALLALASIGLAPAATVNIQISQGANQATNFANKDGSQSNGLVWGILISTANTSFSLILSSFQLGTSLNGTRLGQSDDYLIMSPVLTAQGNAGDLANPGKITSLNSIQINDPLINDIQTGDQFAIIWFDSTVTSPTQDLIGGEWYGIMTNAAWVIPAAGATQNISASFATSPDPVKLANDNVVDGPEPSSVLLGLLGALGLFRRRR